MDNVTTKGRADKPAIRRQLRQRRGRRRPRSSKRQAMVPVAGCDGEPEAGFEGADGRALTALDGENGCPVPDPVIGLAIPFVRMTMATYRTPRFGVAGCSGDPDGTREGPCSAFVAVSRGRQPGKVPDHGNMPTGHVPVGHELELAR